MYHAYDFLNMPFVSACLNSNCLFLSLKSLSVDIWNIRSKSGNPGTSKM